MPREVKQGYTKTIFPKPEAYKMGLTNFEKWLKSFDSESRARVTLSFYRDWPRINLKQIPGEQYGRRIYFYESAFDPTGFVFEPNFSFRDFVLRNAEWGGEGEYRVLCNEQGVKGAIGCSEFTLEDADYPPRVDLRSVVQGWPRNEGFIKSLRAKGVRLPGDDPEADRVAEQEESEMNVAAQLAETLAKNNERLMDRLEEQQEDDRGSASDDSGLAEATSEAVRVVAEGAKEAISIVGTQAKEMARATAPQYNPIDLFKAGRESAGDGGMAMLTFFMGAMEKQTEAMQAMHEKTLDYMREKDEKGVTSGHPQEQANGIDLLLQEGQKFKQLGDLFGWNTRRSRNDDETPMRQIEAPAKESALDKLLGKLAENPTLLVTGIFGITNLVQTFMGKGKPAEEVMKAAGSVAGSIAGQPPSGPDPAQEDERRKQALGNFLRAIEPLFMAHFFDQQKEGLNGYTFAEDFLSMAQAPTGQLVFTPEGPMTELGKQQYDQIKAGGVQQFDAILRNYHPIWSMVGGQMPKYIEFLKQFFNFFEDSEQAAKQRQGKLATVPPPTSA